jgi:Kef-type K+ transport system membrane component KefB
MLLIIVVLTVVAVISKGAAGFMARGKDYDQLGIGFGMIPRGEVGLVFAAFAAANGVFAGETYSALVMVVLLTTLVGPILLKPRLRYF